MTGRHAVTLAMIAALCSIAASADTPWEGFTATNLNGKTVESDQLVGQTTLLIVTPSRDAARSTRRWAQALRKEVAAETVRVRDILAFKLPFFISEDYALERARDKVPAQYHEHTWLLEATHLEKTLGIPPDSSEAAVVVVTKTGDIAARVHGDLSPKRLSDIVSTVQRLQ